MIFLKALRRGVCSGVTSDDLNIVEHKVFVPTSGSDGVIGYATDNDGHGTHIAGMIGALDNNVGVVGVAPGARIHNLKIFGDDLTADVSVAIEAIEHAIDWKLAHPEKPGVMNLSFGENTWSTDYTSLDLVVETAISAGLIVVVAAGNDIVDVSMDHLRVFPAL